MNKLSMISDVELKELKTEEFLRDDTVLLSYYALQSNMKTGQTLLDFLKSQNIITNKQIEKSLMNGPIKLDIKQLPEVRVIVNSYSNASVYVNKSELSEDMKSFNSFKIVKFNAKTEADKFEAFLQDPKHAKQIDNKIKEIMTYSRGSGDDRVFSESIDLYPGSTNPSGSSYSSDDPPFETYLYIIYYNENGNVYGYSDYHIPYNNVDDILAEVTYPIKLDQLTHYDNMYRMENYIAQDWGGEGIYRAYRIYSVDESVEKYQKHLEEVVFSIKFSTMELIDTSTPLDYAMLKEMGANVGGFSYGKTRIPAISGTTTPRNYEHSIFLNYDLKPLGYSVTELEKKPVEQR